MIGAIINGILNALAGVVTFLLTPLNILFNGLFPNMSSAINTFNIFVNNYVGGTLRYFFYILPPTFRGLLILWFTFVIAYYTIYYIYIGYLKIFNIIQKVKFW